MEKYKPKPLKKIRKIHRAWTLAARLEHRRIKEKSKNQNWSGYVTKHSFALDLEEGVFTWDDPRKIAESLKRSAETSSRRKGTPLQSAMSMLNFYINRAGKNLKPARKRILEQTKTDLRKLFKTHS